MQCMWCCTEAELYDHASITAKLQSVEAVLPCVITILVMYIVVSASDIGSS